MPYFATVIMLYPVQPHYASWSITLTCGMVYKNLVPSSQKTQHACIIKTNQFIRFKEISTVYSDIHAGQIKPFSFCKMRRILALVVFTSGGWVGPTAILDDLEKIKSYLPGFECRTVYNVARRVIRPTVLSWLQV